MSRPRALCAAESTSQQPLCNPRTSPSTRQPRQPQQPHPPTTRIAPTVPTLQHLTTPPQQHLPPQHLPLPRHLYSPSPAAPPTPSTPYHSLATAPYVNPQPTLCCCFSSSRRLPQLERHPGTDRSAVVRESIRSTPRCRAGISVPACGVVKADRRNAYKTDDKVAASFHPLHILTPKLLLVVFHPDV